MKTLASDLPLMDLAQQWSFARKHHDIVIAAEAMTAKAAFRSKLRTAERFVLDDNAVRLICHLSHEQDRLEGWSFLARLPYDTMWIEFDLHAKMREFEAMGTLAVKFDPDQVGCRLGFLLYRDDPGGASPRWVCREFYDYTNISGDESGPSLLSYVFDPEGDPMWPVRGSKLHHMPTLSLLPNFPRAPVVITGPIQDGSMFNETDHHVHSLCDAELVLCGLFKFPEGKTGVPATIDAEGHVHVEEDIVLSPEWFTSRAAVIVDPFWTAHFGKRAKTNPGQYHRTIMTAVLESKGMMRWVIVALAAINGLPRDVKPIATRAGRRMMGMSMVPYLSHHSLNISLPRDDRVIWARKTLDRVSHNARRRWHKVIGHWRVVERGKKVNFLCRHLPAMVENGLGMCERCEMIIRWIPAHERGDPTIGMVEHEYNVTAKRQTPPVELGLKGDHGQRS